MYVCTYVTFTESLSCYTYCTECHTYDDTKGNENGMSESGNSSKISQEKSIYTPHLG
jgi:hypothetical protein